MHITQQQRERVNKIQEENFSNAKILEIETLNGMTNNTYCVTLDSGKYVFRLPTKMSENLIDRHNEKIFTLLACELGIDSPITLFDEVSGVKIARYIDEAVTLNCELIKEPENVKLIAQTFKKLHTAQCEQGGVFDYDTIVHQYEQVMREHNVELYADYEQFKQQIFAIRKEFEKRGTKLVPCHCDPLCENWIRSFERIYLVDWEYAGLNDPMWDLADISIEGHFGEKEDSLMLETYFGRAATEDEHYAFNANKAFIDFLWSLWGKTKVAFGEPEFEDYALERYLRMKSFLKLL